MSICVPCASDCSTSLPVLSNGCKPTYKFGQLEDLFISAQPFADYTAGTFDEANEHVGSDFSAFVTDVQTRLGTGTTYNQVSTADSIRKLCVEGSVTSDRSEVAVCKGKTIKGDFTITYTGTLKDLSYANWNYYRTLSECNPELYFLFGTRDTLFGGACCGDAIQGYINFDIDVPDDRNALINVPFTLTIEQSTLPCMFPNVLA